MSNRTELRSGSFVQEDRIWNPVEGKWESRKGTDWEEREDVRARVRRGRSTWQRESVRTSSPDTAETGTPRHAERPQQMPGEIPSSTNRRRSFPARRKEKGVSASLIWLIIVALYMLWMVFGYSD